MVDAADKVMGDALEDVLVKVLRIELIKFS